MTNCGLLYNFFRGRTLKTFHCILHGLLRFHQVLHLCGEQKLQTIAITEPAGHQTLEASWSFDKFKVTACNHYATTWNYLIKKCLLVCHGELVGLLFVAGRQLILDAGHQVVISGAANCPLNNIQPPGRVQLDLEKDR